MRAEDLMIGDWVYSIIYQQTVKKKPIKVTGIRTDSDTPLIQGNDTDVWYDLNTYEPIRLSEKFLEKNGFKFTKPEFTTLSEEQVWAIEDKQRQFRLEMKYQDTDEGIEYYVANASYGCGGFELYISYIHELQHILKMCGINKEIEL